MPFVSSAHPIYMKILDRYIVTKFLKTFLFVVVLLNIVVCVIDYTEKADDFLANDVGMLEILSSYYVNYFLFMANQLSPIAIFVSVVFVTARMSSHSEIIAMLSAGVSFRRLLVPYIGGAAFVGICIFGLVGWVIPNASKEKVAFEVKYLKSPFFFDDRNIHLRESDSTYVYMQSFNNRINTGYRFTIEKFEGNRLAEKLSAEKVTWDSTQQKWNIKKYNHHTFNGDKEKMYAGANLDTAFNITPEYFQSKYKLNETMTLSELSDYIKMERKRGMTKVDMYLYEMYERYAYPFAILILTFMGVIVSARKSRQGAGFQIAIGMFFASAYVLFVVVTRTAAAKGSLDPMLAAWLPNVTFLGISWIMYFTVPR